MQQLRTQVQRVVQSIAEIDAAPQEQASGIGQIGGVRGPASPAVGAPHRLFAAIFQPFCSVLIQTDQ
jgi:hypothetical protein